MRFGMDSFSKSGAELNGIAVQSKRSTDFQQCYVFAFYGLCNQGRLLLARVTIVGIDRGGTELSESPARVLMLQSAHEVPGSNPAKRA
jgi:hypothetical protein